MTADDSSPAPRIILEVLVEFRKNYSRQDDQAVLSNISLTGAFLQMNINDLLKVNDKINIKFNVSGRERKIIAHVVWTGLGGCGIRFNPQNNRDVQIIDDLMYFVKTSKDSRKVVLESIFKKVS